MSKLYTFCFLFLSLSALAQETLVINSKKLTARSQEVILVRNAHSPEKTEIKLQVHMAHQVCVHQDFRTVYRTSGPECGYDYHERQIPTGHQICVETHRNGQCARWRQEYRIERTQVARSCYVREPYCARYGTEMRMKTKDMTLQFKKIPLGGSETETFLVSARQKEYDSDKVKYEVKALSTIRPYKIKKKDTFLGIGNEDDFVISEK